MLMLIIKTRFLLLGNIIIVKADAYIAFADKRVIQM